jgi:hypothetical protein
MDFDVFIPIVAIFATAWVIVTFARLRHRRGDRADDAATDVPTARENVRLARENENLKLTIGRLEERLGVLERIATDPAERTAREIENLRHTS